MKMLYAFKGFALATLLALSSCGGGGPIPPAGADTLPAPEMIAVFGDSIAAGYMTVDGIQQLRQDLSFTLQLRAKKVVTAAVGGSTTQAAFVNQVHWLSPAPATYIVIMLGTNDAALGLSRADALKNVTGIADAFPNAKLVLVSPPYWTEQTEGFFVPWVEDLRKLAADRHGIFVDIHALGAGVQCVTTDHHPCADSHRKFATIINQAIDADQKL